MMATTEAAATERTEDFVARDVATLKAMAEPLRMRLILLLDDGDLTVKEMAVRLGVPPTRLYYHVRILEQFGLVQVVSTRMVSGIEERRYAATAKNWTVSDELLADPAVADVLKAMFDLARVELALALGSGEGTPGDAGGAVPMLMSTRAYLTGDEIREFTQRMYDLISEYTTRTRRPETTEFHAVFTVYSADVRPDDAS